MSRIGILGGTFDPCHIGHIEMALKAKEHLKLKKTVFMPGGNPPHKEEITPAELRFRMVSEAIADYEGLEVWDYEINKKTHSYTADTLGHLKSENPQDDYYFILGGDSLDYLDHWYNPEQIFALAKIVVFSRDDFNIRAKTDSLIKKFGGQIIILDDEIKDVSSTMVRNYVDMGLDISGLVPTGTQKIIYENNLYHHSFTELRKKVESREEPGRFLHTIGVTKAAVKMAEIFGEDPKKAYIAALLHDIAKHISGSEMYDMCKNRGVVLDDAEMENPGLVHAKLGAYLAKAEYGIEDEDIINAIAWHTLGRCEASRLEKIIFVADMVEEGRSFLALEKIRKTAYKNLDKAVYMCADSVIRFNTGKGKKVHPNAYMVREHFKKLIEH